MNKSAIRQIYKQKRSELTSEQIESKSKTIANNFIKNLLPKINDFQNKKLAFYVAANNEVDPIYIINHCQTFGNIFSLPKIINNSLILNFLKYEIGDKLISNKIYSKLLEPETSKQNIIPDIIFVPLISFDKKCFRIGMGGGFYDATIKNYRENYPKTTFIGLGYDTQECELIGAEDHDQSLDFIIFESGILPHDQ